MWSRLRLDIGWRELGRLALYSTISADRQRIQARLESSWSEGRGDALACLSVRSGFDLLLSALGFQKGSEILFSALNIPDMPAIARSHGLVPVPVDLRASDFHIDADSLRRAVSPRAKMIVVAHLFGARPDIGEVLAIARHHDLFVVEDCAQAWFEPRWRGDGRANASLFSFGIIKTATALGGALCRVSDPHVLGAMRELQSCQPVQPARSVLWRACKFTLLKAISMKPAFGLFVKLGNIFGRDIDGLLGGLARGFPGDELLSQLRQQPALGTLRLISRRLQNYDSERIQRRTENARKIIAVLGLQVGRTDHSHWLFPFVTDRPEALVQRLRMHGFDATQRGSLAVIGPPPDRPAPLCPMAVELLARTVFLPCYSELPTEEIERMCQLIADR